MNVPTHNIQGLLIYRELCEKEGRSVGRWRERFGAEALLKDMEPEKMANLAVFDAAFSAPLPLDAQLKQLHIDHTCRRRKGPAHRDKERPLQVAASACACFRRRSVTEHDFRVQINAYTVHGGVVSAKILEALDLWRRFAKGLTNSSHSYVPTSSTLRGTSSKQGWVPHPALRPGVR